MPVEIPWGLEHDEQGAASSISYLPLWVSSEQFVVLDEEDYLWASQWKWSLKPNKNKRKWYAYRTGWFNNRTCSVFLHKQVCLRAYGLPPTPSHTMADHKSSNELDIRRSNLRWVTPAENRGNYNGMYAMQLRMDLKGSQGPVRLLRSHTFGGNRGKDTNVCGSPQRQPDTPADLQEQARKGVPF